MAQLLEGKLCTQQRFPLCRLRVSTNCRTLTQELFPLSHASVHLSRNIVFKKLGSLTNITLRPRRSVPTVMLNRFILFSSSHSVMGSCPTGRKLQQCCQSWREQEGKTTYQLVSIACQELSNDLLCREPPFHSPTAWLSTAKILSCKPYWDAWRMDISLDERY